ncbi:MAG TPA: outer membrane beta-barrel domain-containing protein [Burkholderiaceae bacterium]
MRKPARWNILLIAALGLWPILSSAADQPSTDEPAKQPGAGDQVIQPELDRREVKLLHIPSNDFEFGLFTGDFNTEYFGSDLIGGARLGYHITEDFFAEAVYGDTRATDEVYRQFLPGGIFPSQVQKLRYYEITGGINVLPGELYVWRNTARPSALYLVAGLGSTKFLEQWHFTATAGFGARVWLANWASLQIDMRDHIFSLDILGQRRSTQNLEFSGGVTFFF